MSDSVHKSSGIVEMEGRKKEKGKEWMKGCRVCESGVMLVMMSVSSGFTLKEGPLKNTVEEQFGQCCTECCNIPFPDTLFLPLICSTEPHAVK